MTLAIKWQNVNATEYLISADNLHRMAPDLNTQARPFITGSGPKELTMAGQTDIKLINLGTHRVFEVGAVAQVLVWDALLLDEGAILPGTDYYLYLCDNSDGTATIKASLNATFPLNFTADSSRKIGGFHTLCVDVGVIAGHLLDGYVAGDILPQSVWCLNHRPRRAAPEGMVYAPGAGIWVDIYMASVSGTELGSVYNEIIADGTSAEAFHWYKMGDWMARIGKRFPTGPEFGSFSAGSNQGTNVTGSADPVTTGGWVDTAGVRMISNIGCEDCCGVAWQFGAATEANGAAAYADAFDLNDTGVGGQSYMPPNVARFGGYYGGGVVCGSRANSWDVGALYLGAGVSGRGVAAGE